ncbi:unnamed protein product [Thelazia callipaeda]|uniref:FAST kinase leucine-rich domain-containing protein n=1 Tax=Thelazia callipaeda TaxID=103827 RepID=A0A158RC27_THECL|nr:unnamed protein product [Thelazia callipaeda]
MSFLGNLKTLTLKLCSKNEHVVIGKKKLLWPEKCLPNDIFNLSNALFRIKSDKYSLYVGNSEDYASSASIYSAFTSLGVTESVDNLAEKISHCLEKKDLDTIWADLSRLSKKRIVTTSPFLSITLSAHMQMALVKLLRKHVDEKHFDRVLTFFIHSRLITTSRASSKLIELLASKNLISHAVNFLRSSLILDDQSFASFLKIASEECASGNFSVLLLLLEKPINSCGLRHAVSVNLNETEVAVLIQRLISLCYDKDHEGLFDKVSVLKLMGVLIDSHSQRFIWDEKCHSTIRNAASCSSAMVQLFDLFRHLEQRLNQREKIEDDFSVINNDYIIRNIRFSQKPL